MGLYVGRSKTRESVPLRQRLWQRRPYCHTCGALLDRHKGEIAQTIGANGQTVAVLVCDLTSACAAQ